MKKDDVKEIMQSLFDECLQTLEEKSKDYGSHFDLLTNFKEIARAEDEKPLRIISIMGSKQLNTIRNFTKGRTLVTEPLRKRIVDAINYLCLLYCMAKEEGYDV